MSTSSKSIDALVKETGGKVVTRDINGKKTQAVEYQVKSGNSKSTRYAYAGETANFDAPRINNRDTGQTGSSSYIAPASITSASLTPTTPAPIPPKPSPSSTGTQAMTTVGADVTTATTNADAETAANKAQDTAFQQQLKDLAKAEDARTSSESIYNKTEKDLKIQQKQQAVNNFTNQLNAITAKAAADKLSLVGQGRGVSDVIIGGQQAQIDREAAIQSLPISAQLAAAQGDLNSAQDRLSTLFKIRSEDAEHKYNYKVKVIDAVYNYATAKQKAALDKKKIQDEREFDLLKLDINAAQSLAETAIANGQPSLAARLMALDHNSATYKSDVANLAKGIYVAPKVSTSDGGVGSDGFKNANIESDVRGDAVSLLSDVEARATTIDKAYAKLRLLYSPSEVTDSALKGLLGIGGGGSAEVSGEAISGIEADIARMRKGGVLQDGDIRATLIGKYPLSEVNNSSVSNITDQIRGFIFGER